MIALIPGMATSRISQSSIYSLGAMTIRPRRIVAPSPNTSRYSAAPITGPRNRVYSRNPPSRQKVSTMTPDGTRQIIRGGANLILERPVDSGLLRGTGTSGETQWGA
jgi:hypothetical protein